MSSIKENSIVYFKDDRSKHPYLVHQVLDDKVSLGLRDFPEIEQDWYVSIDKISLFDELERQFAEEVLEQLLD